MKVIGVKKETLPIGRLVVAFTPPSSESTSPDATVGYLQEGPSIRRGSGSFTRPLNDTVEVFPIFPTVVERIREIFTLRRRGFAVYIRIPDVSSASATVKRVGLRGAGMKVTLGNSSR